MTEGNVSGLKAFEGLDLSLPSDLNDFTCSPPLQALFAGLTVGSRRSEPSLSNSVLNVFGDRPRSEVANGHNKSSGYLNGDSVVNGLNQLVGRPPTLERNSIWSPLHNCLSADTWPFRGNSQAVFTWSGQLPQRNKFRQAVYSNKMFLGGIPFDLAERDLLQTFSAFGVVSIQWPGRDVRATVPITNGSQHRCGYAYVIFESPDYVNLLLSNCFTEPGNLEKYFFKVTTSRVKGKQVQVIPFDVADRFYMKGNFNGAPTADLTVFVGALHGMLSAEGLAKVMDDLFGGVIYASLDVDRYKYPLGSGRVVFDNKASYLKAVTAAFVEIRSPRFRKKIQIDPFVENAGQCGHCQKQLGGGGNESPIFCRNLNCFCYFCAACWYKKHGGEIQSAEHRPIIKTKMARY